MRKQAFVPYFFARRVMGHQAEKDFYSPAKGPCSGCVSDTVILFYIANETIVGKMQIRVETEVDASK